MANTRRFRGWTTDAVFMGDVRKVAIASDCRDVVSTLPQWVYLRMSTYLVHFAPLTQAKMMTTILMVDDDQKCAIVAVRPTQCPNCYLLLV